MTIGQPSFMMTGLLTHLVQALNVGTVSTKSVVLRKSHVIKFYT